MDCGSAGDRQKKPTEPAIRHVLQGGLQAGLPHRRVYFSSKLRGVQNHYDGTAYHLRGSSGSDSVEKKPSCIRGPRKLMGGVRETTKVEMHIMREPSLFLCRPFGASGTSVEHSNAGTERKALLFQRDRNPYRFCSQILCFTKTNFSQCAHTRSKWVYS